ncbi:MAG: transporter substrate-binding domain-containing protein [Clostridia bacterium]|nr:transporter substrate-binding domain-containing protein [Clostridia bacterium]
MKKLIALLLAVVLCVSFMSGCNLKKDLDYIQSNGKMTIGITLFAPMNYKDANGELIGFETEFAKAVCKELNVEPNFQVIEWKSKETELKSKNIDCIWNGMTITDELLNNTDISTPYMQNKQVLVVKAENAKKYTDAASLKGAKIVAEANSAGERSAQTNDLFKDAEYTAVDAMSTALMEVKAGTADAAVIDYVMTIGSTGEGTDYANLVMAENISLASEPEQYGIAFRKNSPKTLEAVNAAIKKLAENGTLDEIGKKYKLDELLIVE